MSGNEANMSWMGLSRRNAGAVELRAVVVF
jgi:hypothetical protein